MVSPPSTLPSAEAHKLYVQNLNLGLSIELSILIHKNRENDLAESHRDDASQYLTAGLVIFCGFSFFFSCFTDSFRDEKGVVHYGIATFKGLWIIDGSVTIPPEQASEYRLKVIDFFHAFMSTLVFAAIALFDQNVVNCFYPIASVETMEVLTALPLGIGALGSGFFVTFPTTRRGIGYHLSST
ncbi:protein DMP4-like [Macadamia integrifolia]|uniref:protein DMP4-like n=1 Tax=Macadamia integrifolia TaxID=60698 RepID=UPI001C4FD5B1|nr:protein DMP4-like [Macadamia integrifolia]